MVRFRLIVDIRWHTLKALFVQIVMPSLVIDFFFYYVKELDKGLSCVIWTVGGEALFIIGFHAFPYCMKTC